MGTRILVVEDNAANMELMVYLLRAFGHGVLMASDGVEGLEVARRERPDLILCDIQLPKLDGFEVAAAVREEPALAGVPLVAVTALAMVGDRQKILEAGFNGYVSKPIEPETFVAQVESFLPKEQRSPPWEQPAPSTEMIPPACPVAARATILIVDDSPENLAVFRETLLPFGYAILETATVEEGLDLARRHPPDLIVSDLHIRRESGYDFLRTVKADPDLKAIPFIFLTSTVWRSQDRQSGLDLGADRFLLRPMEPQVLLAEIEDCLHLGKKDAAHADDPGRR